MCSSHEVKIAIFLGLQRERKYIVNYTVGRSTWHIDGLNPYWSLQSNGKIRKVFIGSPGIETCASQTVPHSTLIEFHEEIYCSLVNLEIQKVYKPTEGPEKSCVREHHCITSMCRAIKPSFTEHTATSVAHGHGLGNAGVELHFKLLAIKANVIFPKVRYPWGVCFKRELYWESKEMIFKNWKYISFELWKKVLTEKLVYHNG